MGHVALGSFGMLEERGGGVRENLAIHKEIQIKLKSTAGIEAAKISQL